MSDPHTREIDPVTGHDTTGHEWNGIKELNTPFPKLVIWALVLTFAYSVIAWVLLPAWPLGRDYTRGIWNLRQEDEAITGYRVLATKRQDWLARFSEPDFAALRADTALMQQAIPAAERLFEDNCAACHGATGQGGPGFPVLSDDTWLWSGEPEEIATTIRHGINASDPDTRFGEMPAFDWMEQPDRSALVQFVASLREGTADADTPAAKLFTDNCATCHGENGQGGLGIGAPSLIDSAVIYGQDRATIAKTLRHGRHGVMPSWRNRLSEAEINLLAIYVSGLGDGMEAAR